MIINGGPRGNAGYWSAHLTNEEQNEKVQVVEISGVLSEDLPRALREMEAIAAQSRCAGNFMYAANINPTGDEQLTPKQWKEAVDTLEKELGLSGHQRVVVQHEKDGRTHQHIIWNRVDVDNLRVVDAGGNFYTHERVARDLENRFGLSKTQSLHGELRPDGRPDRPEQQLWEKRNAERTGIDAKQIKAEVTELWRSTDSGKAFVAALEDRGYVLAVGDRRGLCIVDQAGTVHSLARRIEGADTKAVNEKLASIDRTRLPSADDAREAQRTKYPTQEAAREAWKGRELPGEVKAATRELSVSASEIRLAWSLTNSGPGFAAAIEDKGFVLARVTADEARKSERAAAFAKELGRFSPRYTEGQIVVVDPKGSVYTLTETTTGERRPAIEKQLATIDPRPLPSVADAREVMAYVRKAEFVEQQKEARPETKIEAQVTQLLDAAGNAGSFRAALYRDGLIIARVDEQGIVGLEREFKDRERERSLKDDQGPSRHMPTFTVGEVVAVNQLGHVHKLSAYKVDLNRVENALGTLPAMSETRDFLMRDHAAGKQQRADAWADKRTRNEQVQKDRADRKELLRDIYRPVDRSDRAPPPDPVTPALQVADKATGKVMGLMAFAAKLLETPKPPPTPAEQIIANRKALAAMQVLRDEIRRERGEGLSAADVKALPEAVLKGIALLGDDYLRKQIERMDYEQQRRRDDYGRTRER